MSYGKLYIGLRAFLQSSLMVEQAEAAVLEPYQQADGLLGGSYHLGGRGFLLGLLFILAVLLGSIRLLGLLYLYGYVGEAVEVYHAEIALGNPL